MNKKKPKEYPLDVQELDLVGMNDSIYYSKGRHDVEPFLAALQAAFSNNHDEIDFTEPGMLVHVFYEYWRATFPHSDGYSVRYTDAEKGQRGAFPVTVFRWE